MLLALRILNFAIIEEMEVTLGPGLTVLTGETGAGKSILVDALGLLLGGRGGAEVVRAGCSESSVEGLFENRGPLRDRLSGLGLPDFGEEVSVRRVVSNAGRTKAYVNGSLVTAGLLGKLLSGEVEIAGQHEHVALFNPLSHLSWLDASEQVQGALLEYRGHYEALRDLEGKLQSLRDAPQGADAEGLLSAQLEEIRRVCPVPGEEERLEHERRRLGSVERLKQWVGSAESLLRGEEDSSIERLRKVAALVGEASRLDSALVPANEALVGAQLQLEDSAARLGRYLSGLEGNPGRLAEVEDRLDVLRKLCRKHRTDVAGLLNRERDLLAEAQELQHRQQMRQELMEKVEVAQLAAQRAADTLSLARKHTAHELETKIRMLLPQLAMPKARIEVQFTPLPALSTSGQEQVEFLFSANAGDPPRPLHRVASGGEASRLMLALKQALKAPAVATCEVLDEVDSGVSGGTAEAVGRMMKDMSMHRQVLCVTHLPQVAAFADTHLRVVKAERLGKTASRVVCLRTEKEKAQELARMLSGARVTKEAVAAAQALVRTVRQSKRTNLAPDRAVA